MISQLIYLSLRTPECTDDEIKKILDSAMRNNGKHNVTGVLLYSQTKFLQVLEGEEDEIVKLYESIKTDKRHRNVIMVSLKPIEERFFPSWQMGSKMINTETYDFLTKMNSKEQDEFRAILNGEKTGDPINVINKLFK
ncbi:MAG: BLUF domain-containing protein [Leptospiraceae bacterium]|nr:BLUF domain-containing protein [Leptospiraceae bacterium]MCP5513475.1 BLUF domain-containing protein [Leptospiraceae bacterium]